MLQFRFFPSLFKPWTVTVLIPVPFLRISPTHWNWGIRCITLLLFYTVKQTATQWTGNTSCLNNKNDINKVKRLMLNWDESSTRPFITELNRTENHIYDIAAAQNGFWVLQLCRWCKSLGCLLTTFMPVGRPNEPNPVWDDCDRARYQFRARSHRADYSVFYI